MIVARWKAQNRGLTMGDIGADIVSNRLVNAGNVRYNAQDSATRAAAIKAVSSVVAPPPPPPPPPAPDIPNPTDLLPFNKSAALNPGGFGLRLSATGSGASASPLSTKLQNQVQAAYNLMKAKEAAAGTPTVAPAVVALSPEALTTTDGGGGGGGGGSSGTDDSQQPVGWWANLSTVGKVAVVGGGLGVVGLGIYWLTKKRGGGGVSSHKS